MKLLLGIICLTGSYLFAEIIGGLLTGSLALLADSGHMFIDISSLALALFASWFVARQEQKHKEGTARISYGYQRLEVLAAFLNGLLLMGVAGWIILEAFKRLSILLHWIPGGEVHIHGAGMFWVALGGLLVNITSLLILHRSQKESINLKGAYFHIMADLLGSIGAVAASFTVMYFNFTLADPIISLIIAIIIVVSALRLTKNAMHILLEGVPEHVNADEVEATIRNTPHVMAVHDLHIWSITAGRDALSAHVVVDDAAFHMETLQSIQNGLREQFGLDHTTIQLETAAMAEAH